MIKQVWEMRVVTVEINGNLVPSHECIKLTKTKPTKFLEHDVL